MALLDTVKLVTAKRPATIPPSQQRRNKLLKALGEQIALAQAVVTGTTYTATKVRRVINTETGETVTHAVPKRVKQWWFVTANGKLNLAVRYGTKTLALNSKGANSIELADMQQLAPTLELVRQAAEAGELDAAINAACAATRKQFK